MEDKQILLKIRDLHVDFSLRGRQLHALRGISLDVYNGEVVALVGESGSGKSVLCKNLLGLLDKNGRITCGEILFEGKDLTRIRSERAWRDYRGKKIAMIMQDPMTSLNPLKTIGKQIEEAIRLHQNQISEKQIIREKVIGYLRDVGITDPERRYSQYPHEFSGGMRQRVVIAMALACMPKLLICDEPTTALDVTIQAQIIDLLLKLREKYGLTIIFITHDLGVVAHIADRVAVMYAGQIVEWGLTEEIFFSPKHPYTRALLASMPQNGSREAELSSIRGTPPNLFEPICGDAFAPRNPDALKIDFIEEPPCFQITDTHFAKTWLLDPDAVSAKTKKELPPDCSEKEEKQ